MAAASPKPKKRKSATAITKPEFECGFCNKALQTERGLINHLCAPKMRHLDRNNKHNRKGYWAWLQFYKFSYSNTKVRTYEDFSKSNLFAVFIKIGRYLNDINAIHPDEFIKFCLIGKVKVDDWTLPYVYETYLRELTKRETPSDALERNLLLMEQWSMQSGEPLVRFFEKLEPATGVMWIKSGRLSPWVLYTAPSAEQFLTRLSIEQQNLIHTVVEPGFWGAKLKEFANEVTVIRETLATTGL